LLIGCFQEAVSAGFTWPQTTTYLALSFTSVENFTFPKGLSSALFVAIKMKPTPG
jgi:hypothetical protein